MCLLCCLLGCTQGEPVTAQDQDALSAEEKVWGLTVVWSEAKAAFPHFEARPELDWDQAFQTFIPKVLESSDLASYYHELMEFAALLRDGHTAVIPPWGYFTPGHDMPPLELAVIEQRFFVTRTGDTQEIIDQDIYLGLEVLEIADGTPIRTQFQNEVLKYYTRGSSHADESMLIFYLLNGPANEPVHLLVKDTNGSTRDVVLSRNSANRDGSPFIYQFIERSLIADQIESRLLADDILYISIPNFSQDKIAEGFVDLLEHSDLASLRGMIIDVRNNMGGSSRVVNDIVASLVESPVSSTRWHYPQYVAAHRAWGREDPTWASESEMIAPRNGVRYAGPIVILVNAVTNSSSEDFAIILQQAGRATIVGQRTAGGSGNPLSSLLPGGGVFEVSTFKATYPDGTEYASLGIEPDVAVQITIQDVIDGVDRTLETAIDALR